MQSVPLAIKLRHMLHDAESERTKLAQQSADADAAASAGDLQAIKEEVCLPAESEEISPDVSCNFLLCQLLVSGA